MRGTIIKNEGKRGVTYTAIVDVGDSGDRKQKKKTFKSKKDAERWLSETIAAVNRGAYFEPVKISVAEHLQDWLNTYGRQNLTPTTYTGYKIIIEKHLIPELGSIPLSELKPKHVKDYYTKALESGRKDGKKALGSGLSATTVSQHHRVLREALQHAVELEMIPRNPCDAAKPPRKVKHEIKFLPVEDAMKIIDLFKGTYMYIPVFLAVTTGARRAEILGLKWQDVDLRGSVINITRGLYITRETGLLFKEVKNKTSKRAVAISPEVIKVLKKHKADQNEAKLAAGEKYQPNDLVCCLPNGEPINPSTFSKRFQEVVSSAGFKTRFHDLRHYEKQMIMGSVA